MIYLSNLLNQKVWDAFGHVVGQVEDILVSHTDQAMPPIDAILLKKNNSDVRLIKGELIATLWPTIALSVDQRELSDYQPHGHELHLKSVCSTSKLWIPKANAWCVSTMWSSRARINSFWSPVWMLAYAALTSFGFRYCRQVPC